MTQTTAVCALGLLAFSASDFVPISRFSWLMAAALVAALLGDLLFLPALLVGPLGKYFCGRLKKKPTSAPSPNVHGPETHTPHFGGQPAATPDMHSDEPPRRLSA